MTGAGGPGADIEADILSPVREFLRVRFYWMLGLLIALMGVVGLFYSIYQDDIGSVRGGAALFASGCVILLLENVVHKEQNKRAKVAKVDALEREVRDNPSKPQLAWDLARIKLESYLDRNLAQVASIYLLTVAVMGFGMMLVAIAVWRAVNFPDSNTAPIIAAVSGIIIQFIGGTFLVVYRATMEQAEGYVVVLERINAVGMSINILEAIEGDEPNVRNEVRAAIARDLLGMYGMETAAASPQP